MIVRISPSNKTRAIIIATTEDDVTSLKHFYHNKIIFGLYKIWIKDKSGKGENREEVKVILNKISDCKAIGWLNTIEGFVPLNKVEEL